MLARTPASSTLILGKASSLSIVIIASALAIVAFVTSARLNVKFSSASLSKSPINSISTVLLVSPGAKVIVPATD